MSTFALHIENLSQGYVKNRLILKQLSLHVQQGHIFGLIGLNGVGKTTLIKTILGLNPAITGTIQIHGQNYIHPVSRQSLSYLPEKFIPSPLLTGREYIEMTLAYYNMSASKTDIDTAIERFGMPASALDRLISTYSKGMGQKLGLVTSMMSQRPLLILDEPMSGLDPEARLQLKQQLLDYKQQGNSIFFSSHILSDMDEICDQVAILHQGAIQFTGTPAQLKQQTNESSLEKAFLTIIHHSTKENPSCS